MRLAVSKRVIRRELARDHHNSAASDRRTRPVSSALRRAQSAS
jgi:hypothetical protein